MNNRIFVQFYHLKILLLLEDSHNFNLAIDPYDTQNDIKKEGLIHEATQKLKSLEKDD